MKRLVTPLCRGCNTELRLQQQGDAVVWHCPRCPYTEPVSGEWAETVSAFFRSPANTPRTSPAPGRPEEPEQGQASEQQ